MTATLLSQRWRDRAACLGMDTNVFFPENGPASKARRVCAACPVRPECGEHALSAPEPWGVWGGIPERERQKLGRAQVASGTRPAPVRMCASRRHAMTPGNIYTYPGTGAETCRACKAERRAERTRRSSAPGPVPQPRKAAA